jgi:hypothetical protein
MEIWLVFTNHCLGILQDWWLSFFRGIADPLSTKAVGSLTQDFKKCQWPHDSLHLLLDLSVVMSMWVSHTNIGQEFCYCCSKYNSSKLHNLFLYDATLPCEGYFQPLNFDLLLAKNMRHFFKVSVYTKKYVCYIWH